METEALFSPLVGLMAVVVGGDGKLIFKVPLEVKVRIVFAPLVVTVPPVTVKADQSAVT